MSTLLSNLLTSVPPCSSASVSSSSESGSAESRPSSPECIYPIPGCNIWISAEVLSDTLLQMAFREYATCNRLGLCINDFAPDASLWKSIASSDGQVYHVSKPNVIFEPIETQEFRIWPELSLVISTAGLRTILSYRSAATTVHVVERPSVSFPPVSLSSGNIPTKEEFLTLWKAWDLVTLSMIPRTMLHQKPIDLRHKCLFYIGHIPTFLDILLCKSIGGSPSEPAYFWNIFERGIDPHVDDPNHCHSHSEVPEADDDWPTLENIVQFRDRVRAKLTHLYEELASGRRQLTRNIARTLVMTLEHEGFHVETLLYMLIQRAGYGSLPPPGFSPPCWDALLEQWNNNPHPTNETVTLSPTVVKLGHDDSEADDLLPASTTEIIGHEFGWDNESPSRVISVGPVKIHWRPITNSEFSTFMNTTGKGKVAFPRSWVRESGEIMVRTVYGPVSFDIAKEWPVLTSYDDLAKYAQAKGGRIPTEPELRLFLDRYDASFEGGGNTGFRNWHPTPATAGIESHGWKGSNGGVWEWTSTIFDSHPGLVPTQLFPGYSTDFFDGVHHVVLGASYATIPRLTRRSVRNFYQLNYPYSWVGARVAYDM